MTRTMQAGCNLSLIFSLLCTASLGTAYADHESKGSGDAQPATPSSPLTWADVDGDGLLDLFALPPGEAPRILRNAGDGSFEDVTRASGLGAFGGASAALWNDIDGDGSPDLYLVGVDRLLRNMGGFVFRDVTEHAGLGQIKPTVSAEWLDTDGDGRFELLLAGPDGANLFQVRRDFTCVGSPLGPAALAALLRANPVAGFGNTGNLADASTVGSVSGGGGVGALNPPPPQSQFICLSGIRDQAAPSNCIPASTVPTLGMLYPISGDWFVSATGDVGIGTTLPTAKLHVAGDTQVDGQLTVTGVGAPFNVSSADLNTNLNADMLDGLHASDFSQLGAMISTAELEDGSVTQPKLALDSVGSAAIAANAVGASEIAPNAVGASEIAANAVGASEIADNAVGSAEIMLNAVGSGEIAAGAVGNSEIAANAVGASEIAAGAVGASEIAPNAVGPLQIAADAVGASEIAANAVGNSEIAANAVGTSEISAGAVGASEIAMNAVGSSEIATDAVGASEIAANAVGMPEIASGAVGSSEVADGSLLNVDIASNAAISGSKIVPDFVQPVTSGGLSAISYYVGGTGGNGPTNGYLGVQGATDYQGVLTADWGGHEIGVAGISTGGSSNDNYGVFGHSNHVGVRGEHSANPTIDYAELGTSGVGIVASGTTAAGKFSHSVNPLHNYAHLGTGGIGIRTEGTSHSGLFTGELFVQNDGFGGQGIEIVQGTSAAPGTSANSALWVRNYAPGAGANIHNYHTSNTYPALHLEHSNNAADIIRVGNPGDTEFRVNGSGQVYCDASFNGGGADYAEWLERRDPSEVFEPGDVVGVFAGQIAKSVAGAQQIMVISSNPVVVGNCLDADQDTREGHERVAFMGQVPVKVRGEVAIGDLLLPNGDGTARAVAPVLLHAHEVGQVIGTAWEAFTGPGIGLVNAAVGIDQARAAALALGAVQERMQALETRLEAQESVIAASLRELREEIKSLR